MNSKSGQRTEYAHNAIKLRAYELIHTYFRAWSHCVIRGPYTPHERAKIKPWGEYDMHTTNKRPG